MILGYIHGLDHMARCWVESHVNCRCQPCLETVLSYGGHTWRGRVTTKEYLEKKVEELETTSWGSVENCLYCAQRRIGSIKAVFNIMKKRWDSPVRNCSLQSVRGRFISSLLVRTLPPQFPHSGMSPRRFSDKGEDTLDNSKALPLPTLWL